MRKPRPPRSCRAAKTEVDPRLHVPEPRLPSLQEGKGTVDVETIRTTIGGSASEMAPAALSWH